MNDNGKWWIGNSDTDPLEEEIAATLAGKPFRESEPEDIDEEPEVPCNCGNRRTCGECMRQGF